MPTLTPWRHVVAPHPDVQSGRYLQAEFAANLADVRRGKDKDEYRDPGEFFRRTYLTAGMRRLLIAALTRMHGQGEAPVVQLKTAFGGGKTHTMIALYHLLRAPAESQTVPAVRALVEEAGGMPPQVGVAVLVGTDLSATDPSPILQPLGVDVHTLWGELAAQLGNLRGYQVVEDADQAGVAPGADQLRRLLAQVGPCVILMDELVAFLRNLEAPIKKLRAGSLSANLTFLQALTEAVRSTPTAMLIASIPESDDELGGAAGRTVLTKVEKVFGRMEEVWQPVEVHESFEVVRRRLFGPITDEAARDATIAAFGNLYRQNPTDFPQDCREAAYERRMVASYPLHPEVFDRLYEDWASLERFQRTRGVLRLMAKAIHEIWSTDDDSALIMPGSLPLEASSVRNELTRYLGDQWNSVVDTDVRDTSAEIDQQVPRMGAVRAARRLARTILLGSAPERSVKGIEEVRIKLGAVQPEEPGGIAVYIDALHRMRDTLTFLYSTPQGRYWFAVQANLNRTVGDRIGRLSAADVADEIDHRVKLWSTRGGDFAGVHLAPATGAEVPDEDRARLVVLPPSVTHRRTDNRSEAIQQAGRILEQRGTSPRHYRNMLLFLAANADDYPNIESEARRYLAWKSVNEERRQLNLDEVQQQQAEKTLATANTTLDARLKAAYQWLLNPVQEGIDPLEWEATYLTGGSDDPIKRASDAALRAGILITAWSPVALQHEFQRYLWKAGEPHIAVKTLWQQLATFNYLPRLLSADVLKDTIRTGASSQDYFGYATSRDPATGKYQGLSFGRQPTAVFIDEHSVLVSTHAAHEAQAAAAPGGGSVGLDATSTGTKHVPVGNGSATDETGGSYKPSGSSPTGTVVVPKPTRFYGRIEVDPLRFSSLASQISAEVLQHLMGAGVSVEVTIEIQADIPGGAADTVVRTVTENAHTLKFKAAEFE